MVVTLNNKQLNLTPEQVYFLTGLVKEDFTHDFENSYKDLLESLSNVDENTLSRIGIRYENKR